MNDRRSPMGVEELRAIDLNAAWLGLSPSLLMEAAGEAVARELAARVKPGSSVLVLCGSGNNGGDGLVAARRLSAIGYDVTVGLTGKAEELSGPPKEKLELLSQLYTVKVLERVDAEAVRRLLASAQAVIVALVGTGVKGPLREPIRSIVVAVNASKAFKLAVDVPAGIDPDTGEGGDVSLRADLTVTMHAPKLGFARRRLNYAVADIGIPREAETLVGPGDVSMALRARKPTAKKGDMGKLLVIGGGKYYTGAPALAALGAMRTGVDLVAVATPESAAATIRSYSPAIIVHPLKGDVLSEESVSELSPIITRYDAVVFGMGIGREPETMDAVPKIVSELKKLGKPYLIDADALHALPESPGGVLTPHAGEFAAMTGSKPSEEPDRGPEFERLMTARVNDVVRASLKLGSVILLKGKYDVITDGKRYKLDGTGNPGMAVGGVGDVLSGVIGAFLSWKNEPFRAACAGSFVTGVAGDIAASKKGYHLLATDVIDSIPDAFSKYWPGYRFLPPGKVALS
ncbi:NAD(P)H-hydrate dehydratase [Tardisphaera miroshnichenkoae]